MIYSAGIIFYKRTQRTVKFLMVTPGGPYWAHRKLWSFPKGIIEKGEDDLHTAIREFKEETGYSFPRFKSYRYFGYIKQNKNKTVAVFATEDLSPDIPIIFKCESTVAIEYPKGSGKFKEIKEIGEYKWMTYKEILENPHVKAYEPIYKEINDLFNN